MITNVQMDRALTPSPPPLPGSQPPPPSPPPLPRSPQKAITDTIGRVTLLSLEAAERRVAEGTGFQGSGPQLPQWITNVFMLQLHKKLERMTEQNISMKDPYTSDNVVQVSDQPE